MGAPVRVLVADDLPKRREMVLELLRARTGRLAQAVDLEEAVGRPGGQAVELPAGFSKAILIIGADDPARLLHHAPVSWRGDDRGIVLHGTGVRDWPVSVKARLLLAARCALLDDDDPDFPEALGRAVGELVDRLVRREGEGRKGGE